MKDVDGRRLVHCDVPDPAASAVNNDGKWVYLYSSLLPWTSLRIFHLRFSLTSTTPTDGTVVLKECLPLDHRAFCERLNEKAFLKSVFGIVVRRL